MHAFRTLAATAALLVNLGLVSTLEFGKNAPFQIAGIQKNTEGFGSEGVAVNEELAALAPSPERHEKNASVPLLQDRSLELTKRQSTCNAGYWYCSSK